jgi:hypothetical protein
LADDLLRRHEEGGWVYLNTATGLIVIRRTPSGGQASLDLSSPPIAQADASRAYRGLSTYRIQLVLEDDGWHVDYELKDPNLKGGGPHYLIDARTGVILSKRYEQ